MHRIVLALDGDHRRQVHGGVGEFVDDGILVRRQHLLDVGDVEGAAALVGGVLLPVEVLLEGLRIERRAVVEFHALAELEGPAHVIVGMGPGHRELWRGRALVVERGQRVEDRGGRGEGGGVVDTDLERIEARDIQLLADRDAASRLLSLGGHS
ncbi:hypothetical protein GCM10007858_22720 [Bradyrhizobium liaoningense]|nr:hypothetical protein GCM10007858_22720 [Bradyrhizobium liaoningense]